VKETAVGGIERKSTRVWASDSDYDGKKLFNKVGLLPTGSIIVHIKYMVVCIECVQLECNKLRYIKYTSANMRFSC